jgi:hypothetical protein
MLSSSSRSLPWFDASLHVDDPSCCRQQPSRRWKPRVKELQSPSLFSVTRKSKLKATPRAVHATSSTSAQVMEEVTRATPRPLLVKVYDEFDFGPIQSSDGPRGGLLTMTTSALAGPWRRRDEESGLHFGPIGLPMDSWR